MSDIPADAAPAEPKRRARLMIPAVVTVAGLAAFAAGFLGFVSPTALISGAGPAENRAPPPDFVDVPRIVVPMAGRDRQLALGIKLETAPADVAGIELMMPRISDSFTGFLSDIDPAAIDRRGVLEIIRGELQLRAGMLLGPDITANVLITEFAIQ